MSSRSCTNAKLTSTRSENIFARSTEDINAHRHSETKNHKNPAMHLALSRSAEGSRLRKAFQGSRATRTVVCSHVARQLRRTN